MKLSLGSAEANWSTTRDFVAPFAFAVSALVQGVEGDAGNVGLAVATALGLPFLFRQLDKMGENYPFKDLMTRTEYVVITGVCMFLTYENFSALIQMASNTP